jgi:hypothetical protein
MIEQVKIPLLSSVNNSSLNSNNIDAMNYDGSFRIRYRITSKDKSRNSEWSQVHKLPLPENKTIYEINGFEAPSFSSENLWSDTYVDQPNLSCSIKLLETGKNNSFSVTWDTPKKTPTSFYDVYLSWRKAIFLSTSTTVSNTFGVPGQPGNHYAELTVPSLDNLKVGDQVFFVDGASAGKSGDGRLTIIEFIDSTNIKVLLTITNGVTSSPPLDGTAGQLWVLKEWDGWDYAGTTQSNSLNFTRKLKETDNEMYLYVQAYVRLSDFPKNKYPYSSFSTPISGTNVVDANYANNFISISEPFSMLSSGELLSDTATGGTYQKGIRGLIGTVSAVSATGPWNATITRMNLPLTVDTIRTGDNIDNTAALNIIGKRIYAEDSGGGFGSGEVRVASYVNKTSFRITSTALITAGYVNNIRF